MEKEELQEKYYRMQAYEEQMQQMQKQKDQLAEQCNHLDTIQVAVKEMAEVEKGTPVLVPLSSGIFIKAQLEDPHEMLVNMGAHVNVKKTPEQVCVLLKTQSEELKKTKIELEEKQMQLMTTMEKMREELMKELG